MGLKSSIGLLFSRESMGASIYRDLRRTFVYFTGIFILLFIYFKNLIFIPLAVISFILFFVFNKLQYKKFNQLQERLREEEKKNPKEFANGQTILLMIIVFISFLIILFEIVNFNNPYNKMGGISFIITGLTILLIVAIIILTISNYLKRNKK